MLWTSSLRFSHITKHSWVNVVIDQLLLVMIESLYTEISVRLIMKRGLQRFEEAFSDLHNLSTIVGSNVVIDQSLLVMIEWIIAR